MKFFTAKIFSLVLLLCASVAVKADHYVNDRDCCPTSCYECGCNPLYCGAWDLQVQGGVNPIVWRDRGEFAIIDCNFAQPAGPRVPLFDVPKFRDFYRTPWIVGLQVGHHLSDNTRIYLEFNYSQARAKTDPSLTTVNPVLAGQTLTFDLDKYKLFDGHVGVRYYWDRWCDRLSFFLGGKVGFTRHHEVEFSSTLTVGGGTVQFIVADSVLFRKNTSVSGGANFGLDYCFCGNFSFVLTGEVVASCGPRAFPVVDTLDVQTPNFLVGHIGNELRFPITAGIRYSF